MLPGPQPTPPNSRRGQIRTGPLPVAPGRPRLLLTSPGRALRRPCGCRHGPGLTVRVHGGTIPPWNGLCWLIGGGIVALAASVLLG
jgi:hypothetical protein